MMKVLWILHWNADTRSFECIDPIIGFNHPRTGAPMIQNAWINTDSATMYPKVGGR